MGCWFVTTCSIPKCNDCDKLLWKWLSFKVQCGTHLCTCFFFFSFAVCVLVFINLSLSFILLLFICLCPSCFLSPLIFWFSIIYILMICKCLQSFWIELPHHGHLCLSESQDFDDSKWSINAFEGRYQNPVVDNHAARVQSQWPKMQQTSLGKSR